MRGAARSRLTPRAGRAGRQHKWACARVPQDTHARVSSNARSKRLCTTSHRARLNRPRARAGARTRASARQVVADTAQRVMRNSSFHSSFRCQQHAPYSNVATHASCGASGSTTRAFKQGQSGRQSPPWRANSVKVSRDRCTCLACERQVAAGTAQRGMKNCRFHSSLRGRQQVLCDKVKTHASNGASGSTTQTGTCLNAS